MPKPKYIKISREVNGQLIIGQCTDIALAAWEQRGWTVVDDGSSETALTSTVSDQSDEGQMELPLDDDENVGEDQ